MPTTRPRPNAAADASRPRRSLRGYVLRGVALGGLLAVAAVIVALGNRLAALPMEDDPPPSPPVVSRPPPAPEVVFQRAKLPIVAVESVGPDGRKPVGAGIVIDDEGRVLTCLHVAVQMVHGAVRFPEGATYEIEGYAAFDPHRDLALLKLRQKPPSLPPAAEIASAPGGRPIIVAVGHPASGPSFAAISGRLSQSLTSAEMTPEIREFLANLTLGDEPVTWLQHTARLDEGYSGGPLLALNGDVIGINVWVDDRQRFGYALPKTEIDAFLGLPRGTLRPLEQLARPDVRERAKRWQLSGGQLLRVLDHSRALQWQPATWDDYQILRQLAAGVTLAHRPDLLDAEGSVEKHVEDLAKAADKVTAELRRKRWSDAGQILLINEFASQALEESTGGLFAFARVVKIIDADDEPVALCRLAGFEQDFLVPLAGRLQSPEVGSQFLLLGMQQIAPTRPGTKPRPHVIAHLFLPLEK